MGILLNMIFVCEPTLCISGLWHPAVHKHIGMHKWNAVLTNTVTNLTQRNSFYRMQMCLLGETCLLPDSCLVTKFIRLNEIQQLFTAPRLQGSRDGWMVYNNGECGSSPGCSLWLARGEEQWGLTLLPPYRKQIRKYVGYLFVTWHQTFKDNFKTNTNIDHLITIVTEKCCVLAWLQMLIWHTHTHTLKTSQTLLQTKRPSTLRPEIYLV